MKLTRKCGVFLLSPFFVLALFCVYMTLTGLYPFGRLSIAWCDMTQQVIPFLNDFKDIIAGRESLFYNLANAGGMNFFGVFLFFLASPFSILAAFVDKVDMMQFCNILVVLKLALCALCAHVLLHSRVPELCPALHILFSVSYALCGYGMLFYQNLIWLDVMALFPLLLMSLYRVFEKGRGGFFTLMLVLAVCINFYLSYMLVLCAILFGGLYLLLYRETRTDKAGAVFCFSSLLALLLSAPVWLPAFLQYMASARTVGILESLRSGSFLSYLTTVLPVLLSSGVILCVFLAGKDLFRKRDQSLLLLLFVLTIVPLIFEPVNKMWHTGNYMGFPARYGYMPVLFAILMLATHLNAYISSSSAGRRIGGAGIFRIRPQKTSLAVFFYILAFIILSNALAIHLLNAHYEEATRYSRTLWGDTTSLKYVFILFLIFAAGYLFAFLAYKKRKIALSSFALLLFVSIAFEGYVNVSLYMAAPAHKDTSYRYVADLAGKISGEDGFYRVKTQEKLFDVNMIGGAGYSSLSHYSSLTQESAMAFQKSLGYSSYWMELGAHGGTLFSDALLQNKYTIVRAGVKGALYLNDAYAIVPAPYTLPGGIVTSRDLSRQTELSSGSRLDVQKSLARELFGIDDLFISYSPIKNGKLSYDVSDDGRTHLLLTGGTNVGTLRYEIEVKSRQTLYFDCFDKISSRLKEPINECVSVTVNGNALISSYPAQFQNGLLRLGSFENESVTVDVHVKRSLDVRSFGVFGLFEEKLAALEAPDAALFADGGRITAVCKANHGDHLLLPLFYDAGLTATVNGRRVEIERVFAELCYVPLEAGENIVALSFVPQGILPGLIISCCGLFFSIIYLITRKRIDFYPKWVKKTGTSVLFATSALTFLCVYVAPIVIYKMRK